MSIIYAITMFLSAALVFVVQPMVAKMLLPSLGGSSAVWTTCMLFFQAALLAGYGYAHLGARLVTPRRQAIIHTVLMLAAAATLPITIEAELLGEAHAPIVWLLTTLTLTVGLPFFVVSTSAPLFQHWFAHTEHPDAGDPYHLYAASNLGSMVALLGYPVAVEPFLTVREQSWAWSIGYGVLVILTVVCAAFIRRDSLVGDAAKTNASARGDVPSLGLGRRARWILLAFIPSSLMLGSTQYLTTDIASVPLLWVLPLALYLLTFILAFSRRGVRLPRHLKHALPLVVLIVLSASGFDIPMFVIILGHLAMFFFLAMFFHGSLAEDRPDPSHLTEYFLLISVGGALGGLFNGVVAPLVFDRALEYWVVLVLAVALIPPDPRRLADPYRTTWLFPAFYVPFGGYYLWSVGFLDFREPWTFFAAVAVLGAAFALSVWRPRLEHVAIAGVIVFGIAEQQTTRGIVSYERSFFGAYKVFDRTYRGEGDTKREFRKFSHGTTSHGAQSLDDDMRDVPVAYHHPEGPVGQILDAIPHERVAVVGLGAGAMAAYAEPGTHFDFYEIDPVVEDIAREHFTYLKDCGDRCSVEVGDGRLLLGAKPDDHYDIIFLDAYNSDSVPTHLLTRQALQLYFEKLKPDGVVVFHVSNRYLDVEGVVGALAEDAGVPTVTQLHHPPMRLRSLQVRTSVYTAVAPRRDNLKPLEDDEYERWGETDTADVVWTDDFTNIITVFDWD